MFAATPKLSALRAGTSIHAPSRPCGLPALSVYLPGCTTCLVSLPALLTYLRCRLPVCHLPALLSYLSCQLACLVSLPALLPTCHVAYLLVTYLPCCPTCLVTYLPFCLPALSPPCLVTYCLVTYLSCHLPALSHTCPVVLPALSAYPHGCHLPCQPIRLSPPALLAYLPCWHTRLVGLPALSACLPCRLACLVGWPALSAGLPCRPSTNTRQVVVFVLICLEHSTSLG